MWLDPASFTRWLMDISIVPILWLLPCNTAVSVGYKFSRLCIFMSLGVNPGVKLLAPIVTLDVMF